MTDYRLYRLDKDRRVAGPALILQQETDAAAIAAVRLHMADQTIEIWDGARLVCTIVALTKQ